MADLPQFPDPREDPRITALEDRIERAMQGIADLNRLRRHGDPGYNVDANIKLVARVEALASVLVSTGVIDLVEFTGEHLIREAESLEAALAAFTEDRRRRTGLIVPPSANGNGGG